MRVEGRGSRVWGLGFRVQGFGRGVEGVRLHGNGALVRVPRKGTLGQQGRT